MAIQHLQVQESAGAIALAESVAAGQTKLRIRIIAGDVKGSSGYYSREVVERDGPKVFPIGTHMHMDHQSFEQFWQFPAGSLKDLAGYIASTPVYEADNPKGQGLYADAVVFSEYAKFIKEAKDVIGVSIRAAATSEPAMVGEEEMDVITQIVAGLSVDFVTHPGANGRITEVLEHARPTDLAIKAGNTVKERKPMAEVTEEMVAGLKTAIEALTAAMIPKPVEEADKPKPVDVKNVIKESAALLAASELPAAAHKRVLDAVDGETTLAAAIEAEKTYIASLGGIKKEQAGEQHQESGADVWLSQFVGSGATVGNVSEASDDEVFAAFLGGRK